jgi:hypothetical protein
MESAEMNTQNADTRAVLKTTDKKSPILFLLKSADLNYAVHYGIKIQENGLLTVDVALPAAELPSELKEILQNSDFQRAVSVIAIPDLKIECRKGGSVLAVEHYACYAALTPEGAQWVGLHVHGENTLLAFYESTGEFLDWWVSYMVSPTDLEVGNAINGEYSLEALVCVLHAVDCCRRHHMVSMLNYAKETASAVTAGNYIAALKEALTSGDIRWLLPSLFAMTPGLGGITLDIKAEHLAQAIESGLFYRFIDKDETEYFRFNKPSMDMGLEFFSWIYASGWEFSSLSPAGERKLSRGFLASTAAANHLFSIDEAEPGRYYATHEALTADGMRNKMGNCMENILSELRKISMLSNKADKAAFCISCGYPVAVGDKFCPSCGKAT